MSAALATQENKRAAPAIIKGADPLEIVQIALAGGASIDQIDKLLQMAEREQARKAKIAFESAVAAFAANPPAVVRNKLVDFATNAGRTRYKHASLDAVCTQLKPALAKHGLSHRWRTEQIEGGMIRVTCILTHAEGHSESTSLQCPSDCSGGKNAVQGIGSTVTYLERYTLLAACGIAVVGDDDGAAAGKGKEDAGVISAEQVKQLKDALKESAGDVDKFCEMFRIPSLDQLPASYFKRGLEAARQRKANSGQQSNGTKAPAVNPTLLKTGYSAALLGVAALETWWKKLSKTDDAKTLKPYLDKFLKEIAAGRDRDGDAWEPPTFEEVLNGGKK